MDDNEESYDDELSESLRLFDELLSEFTPEQLDTFLDENRSPSPEIVKNY